MAFRICPVFLSWFLDSTVLNPGFGCMICTLFLNWAKHMTKLHSHVPLNQ